MMTIKMLFNRVKNSTPVQKISVMMLATIVTRAIGMLREMILGSTLGASAVADAYVVAFSIPCTMVTALLTAISLTFVPGYIKEKTNGGTERALHYTNIIINIILIMTAALVTLILVFAEPIVKVVANGFNAETMMLATVMCRYMSFTVIFQGITYVLTGYLHSNDEFTAPAFYSLPSNIIMILSILSYRTWGINSLSIGVIIAYISQTVFMLFVCVRKGYRYKPVLNSKMESVRSTIISAFPIMLSMAFGDINIMADKMVASNLNEGSISALNYASKVNECLYVVFCTTLATWIFPKISGMIANGDLDAVTRNLKKAIVASINLVMPFIALCFVFAPQGIQILFERGAFDETATVMTAGALRFYCIGILFHTIREIVSRVFFASGNTKIPMRITVISVIVNVVFNILLAQIWGLNGVAFASTISAAVSMLVTVYWLKKEKVSIDILFCVKTLFRSFLLIAPAIIVSYIVFYNTRAFAVGKQGVLFLLMCMCAVIAFLIYAINLWLSSRLLSKKEW